MKRLVLEREREQDGVILGTISALDLHTLEQPWVPTAPGGEPFNSCVPAGLYQLVPFTRPNGHKVVALINKGLGVYLHKVDRPGAAVGRYLILIHVGNWLKDISGCIAVGENRVTTPAVEGPMVVRSKDAMQKLMEYEPEELLIMGVNGYDR